MGRAPCCQKLGLKQGKWTKEEDGILANYIAQHGEGSWRSLPKNAGLLRCGKSCRLRWLNYLRDGLRRGKFSKVEDDLIAKLHAIHGNRAVSRIMKSLEMDNRRAGHNRRCTGGEKYLPTPYAETTT